MNFLDYRKALGIGMDNDYKTKCFAAKMKMYVNRIFRIADVNWNDIYYEYCLLTYSEYDWEILNSEFRSGVDGIEEILERNYESIKQFLVYYMELVDLLKKYDYNFSDKYIEFVTNTLKELGIGYEIIVDGNRKFIFPNGAKELDKGLVTDVLGWLKEYPISRKKFIDALVEYSNKSEYNISNIADEFRKALESFFQEFFNSKKSLENYKSEYGKYLKDHGVPKEISNNFYIILNLYNTFINNYAKHHDRTSKNVLEYIMYQTGNIIRLLIIVKREKNDVIRWD